MRRPVIVSEDRVARLLTALTGLTLLASAALAAGIGRGHMALCGAGAEAHCDWCRAAAGFALGGLAALTLAARRSALVARAER